MKFGEKFVGITWEELEIGARGAGYEQNVYIYEILKEEIKYILKGQIDCYNECSLPIEYPVSVCSIILHNSWGNTVIQE